MLETPSIRRYSFMSHPFPRVDGMGSENPSGADNQQERPSSSNWLDQIPRDLGNWVAGFVDGEGSFNVPIRRERDRGLPWRVSLSFNVSQIGRELLELLRSVFEWERLETAVTVFSILKSPDPGICSNGSSRSSSSSRYAVRKKEILRSFVGSPSSSCQVGTCRLRESVTSST